MQRIALLVTPRHAMREPFALISAYLFPWPLVSLESAKPHNKFLKTVALEVTSERSDRVKSSVQCHHGALAPQPFLFVQKKTDAAHCHSRNVLDHAPFEFFEARAKSGWNDTTTFNRRSPVYANASYPANDPNGGEGGYARVSLGVVRLL